MERLASAAFEFDTRSGHHKSGPWTWHMIGDEGRQNYRALVTAILDELDRASNTESEAVDHPAHYGGADNPYEAIKVIEAWELGFCLGNAVKYISRAGKKGDAIEDLEKAHWYISREIERLEQRVCDERAALRLDQRGGRVVIDRALNCALALVMIMLTICACATFAWFGWLGWTWIS